MIALSAPTRILLDAHGSPVTDEEEAAFFTALNQSNGTTRMTSSRRLDDLNQAIEALLPERDMVSLLDVGISSGISSAEWLDSVRTSGHAAALTAVDQFVFARLFRLGRLQLLAEREGYVLLVHTGNRSYFHPVARTGSLRNRISRITFASVGGLARLGYLFRLGTEVALISRFLRDRHDVRVLEVDIFLPLLEWHGKFDVVRIANVLNLSYFDERRVSTGLANAARWVRTGGLLAVCRTEFDGCNHATIFRRTVEGLIPESRLGNGSEVERLAPTRLT